MRMRRRTSPRPPSRGLLSVEIASGEAFEGYERTVDAHVKNIRRKLGEDTKHPSYLHTVIGVGYKVEA